MGTTLTNGIYLPNEGEKNCYAGLKTNWETLDQKIADIAALQQAVAGALHREIVESLPTTDIDPNTIYMILSGTSATENIYDEYMYVNNAWELIGTSATDLTNYYTKGEVDGLLLLKANASDLTSHTGDTDIHVTASDKTKWTNSANTHVLRLALSALTPSTSDNSFSNLDDATALKVGDKVMDTAGVLFEVTAIDTANSTFTIGTSLIDLAQDSDVVHKSGNETVGGEKTFDAGQIQVKSTIQEMGVIPQTSTLQYMSFMDKNNVIHGLVGLWDYDNGASEIQLNISDIFKNGVKDKTGTLDTSFFSFGFLSTGVKFTTFGGQLNNSLIPLVNSTYDVGSSNHKWGGIYATNYYYGSNNVEFSTKFVTTDTAQTISGNKTFSGNVLIHDSNPFVDPKYLILRNQKVKRGSTTETGAQFITFHDKDSGTLVSYETNVLPTGNTQAYINASNLDANSQRVVGGVKLIKTPTETWFIPDGNNTVSLGLSNYKWKDVQTYQINGVEPSSLSLPSDRSARVDISSYITNLGNGNNNKYTVPANGYIWLHFTSINSALCYSQTPGGLTNYAQTFARYQGDGQLYAFFPVRKDDAFVVQIYTSSTAVVQMAYFIPCQGNV